MIVVSSGIGDRRGRPGRASRKVVSVEKGGCSAGKINLVRVQVQARPFAFAPSELVEGGKHKQGRNKKEK